MSKIEELVDNLIAEKRYDERLVPFIKSFVLYNVKQQFWDEKTAQKKIELYKNRIDEIEFINLENEKVLIDFDLKTLIIDKNAIHNSTVNEKIELMSAVFEEQEIAVKDDKVNSLNFYKKEKNYDIERLKYTTNQKDKQSVLNMICNAFNRTPREIYEITNLINQEIEENSDNEQVREYLEDLRTTFLPGINNAVKNILNATSQLQKKEEYKKIYSISLMALKFRLENPNENKNLIQEQYNCLEREFSRIAEEYVIMVSELENVRINTGWELNSAEINNQIQNELKKMQVQQEDNILSGQDLVEIDYFAKEVDIEDLKQLTSNPKKTNNTLTQEYVEQKIEDLSIRYEERFRPIIKEYFRRSVQVYGWSKDEFNKKIKNYAIEVEQIKIEKDLNNSEISTAGNSKHKEINIRKDFSDKKNSNILDIFFHEEEHSTDRTNRGRKTIEDGLKHININEYATEIGAMHLVGERIYDDSLCFTHSMEGYDEFKYAGSMMAAALGISEFEFAKLRDKGEIVFNKYMEEKYPYMNTEWLIETFENILQQIKEAPSIIHMQQMSEIYANMYNLSSEILKKRLEYERENLSIEDKEKFELKSKYEKTKIAYNMQQAKRKLHLRNKYIKPIIGKDNTIKSDAKVNKEDREKYIYLVEKLYPEKNVHFYNRSILKHIDREIKHPMKGKIDRFLNRKKIPLLPEGQTTTTQNTSKPSDLNGRRKFAQQYEYKVANDPTNLRDTDNQKTNITEKTIDE